MDADPVRAYYDALSEREWERLARPDDGAIEAALHERALREFLPPITDPTQPPAVLDIGGGPGRWTFWLAGMGYAPTLVELSPELVKVARRKLAELPFAVQNRIAGIATGDVRDLSRFPDAAFDAVVALGPFYHLPEPDERRRALAETRRVLKPGGVLLAALMPRHQRFLAAVLDPGETRTVEALATLILEDGRWDDLRTGRFTGAGLVEPAEVAPFFEAQGFATRRLMASQGNLGLLQTEVAALKERDPARYAALLDTAYRTAADPSILGLAGHLLYVGKRVN